MLKSKGGMNNPKNYKIGKFIGIFYGVLAVGIIIWGVSSLDFSTLAKPSENYEESQSRFHRSRKSTHPVSLESPGKQQEEGREKVTFDSIGGIEEAKTELAEIVDFLKEPEKYQKLGAKLPRGVLLSGPPGTGKTMIAKAIAGEADRPFLFMSGSEFVEMYVGVGASRVRALFEQAKEIAPCILFIDEIDTLGSKRGVSQESEERVQTLNQFLVELDGFDTNLGIIVIAATNRPEILDPALLRSGRFDRRVEIPLPDLKGRMDILNLISKNVLLDVENVDLEAIAKTTSGASGADLANILNESALLAARNDCELITQEELQEARDKVLFGNHRKSLVLTEVEKTATAYHEAGHTTVSHFVKFADRAEKVTIVPRGGSLGHTMFAPIERTSFWRREMIDRLSVIMGGRAAEEVFLGDVSSGAQNDMEKATAIAKAMVLKWGMNDTIGLVVYNPHHDNSYSSETAALIDKEVKKILDEAYSRAVQLLKEKRTLVELMVKRLVEKETLNAEEIDMILHGSKAKGKVESAGA